MAAEIAATAREPARVVLDVWMQGGPATACAFVCIHLRELALDEMLRRAETAPDPGVRAQLLELGVRQQSLFREYLLALLEPSQPEEYLLIRRLVEPLASEADQFSTEAEFLALDERQRWRETRRWAESESWNSLLCSPPELALRRRRRHERATDRGTRDGSPGPAREGDPRSSRPPTRPDASPTGLASHRWHRLPTRCRGLPSRR